MKFYALYSNSSCTYNTPFLAHDDEEAKRIIEKSVTMQNDPALLYSLDDLQIELVGTFDPADNNHPIRHTVDNIVVCEDLVNELCYPPMIHTMLMKLYHKKEVAQDDQ